MKKEIPKKLSYIKVPRKYDKVQDVYEAIKDRREDIKEWNVISDEKK